MKDIIVIVSIAVGFCGLVVAIYFFRLFIDGRRLRKPMYIKDMKYLLDQERDCQNIERSRKSEMNPDRRAAVGLHAAIDGAEGGGTGSKYTERRA